MAPTGKIQSKTAPKTGGGAAPAGLISLAPSTFATGGGLIDDADVTVKDAGFLMWDYNGNAPEGPALGITFVKDEEPDVDHDQYFSAGKAEFFVPSEDGKGLVSVSDKTAITNGCNAAIFLASLISCGVPESLVASGDITNIIGMKLHINRIPAPKRAGLEQDPNKKYEVLIATKLIALPGEAAAPAKKGFGSATASKTAAAATRPTSVAPSSKTTTSPSNGAAAAAADVDDELVAETTATLVQVLGENDGKLARKNIGPKVFAAVEKTNPRRSDIMKLAFSEEFLGTAGDGMWTYDGTSVSLG